MSERRFQINPGPLRLTGPRVRPAYLPDVTKLQLNVLGVVGEHGPLTAAEVGRHLHLEASSARGFLSRLERKVLVDAEYTTTRPGYSGRTYVLSDRGQRLVDIAFGDEDE